MSVVVTLIAATQAVKRAPRAPLEKPNVVLFFVDDLGYGDVGFNGHPTTLTPNIDQLAFSGKVLTTWYSACPVCSCSRASLMTGRQWARMGIPGVFSPTTNSGLPLNETTMASQLKEAGYSTGICGKVPSRDIPDCLALPSMPCFTCSLSNLARSGTLGSVRHICLQHEASTRILASPTAMIWVKRGHRRATGSELHAVRLE